jgi:lactoylglutathione lyase
MAPWAPSSTARSLEEIDVTELSYRLDHIALLVRDLDETARFFTDVLRIREVPDPMGGTEIRWFEFGNGQRFHIQAGDISTTHVEKRTHFAFSAADFDEVLEYLRFKQVAFSDFKGTPGAVNVRPDGMRAVFVQDPNGYWYEINDFR